MQDRSGAACQWGKEMHPGSGLRGLLQEAIEALVLMNADRLEELARCCVDLNRDLPGWNEGCQPTTARLNVGLGLDLELFGQILQETRANIRVLNRLRTPQFHIAGYSREPAMCMSAQRREAEYGDN